MKRVIATFAALALSLTLAGCGSSNQANAIKAACNLAAANDFAGTSEAFSEIARNDPSYLISAVGTRWWSAYKGKPWDAVGYENKRDLLWDSLQEFYALCAIENYI